jgi:Polyketide cyclase / dehydrase and lipid transport
MAQVQAITRRQVAAAPDAVVAAIADYSAVRPKLLPAPYSQFAVQSGGQGAGTVAAWHLQATEKRSRDLLVTVTQPDPATVVETDANSSMVITWVVAPAGDGSVVSVETRWDGAGGVGGFFERTFAPKGINRIHDQVLANLAAHVEG